MKRAQCWAMGMHAKALETIHMYIISVSNAVDIHSTIYAIYKLNLDTYLPEEDMLDKVFCGFF
jgi:hypothetical protein